MFIIVAIIYHNCAIVSSQSSIVPRINCDCDVLQITTFGFSSNFTKQNGLISRKPYYLSMKQTLISWNNQKWSYNKYDSKLKRFMPKIKFNTNFFSFENMCKNVTKELNWKGKNIDITSQCLRHNSNCLATNEVTWKHSTGSKTKEIKLQAKNPCKFPFIYKNVTYSSCRNVKQDKFRCATTVNARNYATSWGYCSESCPLEEDHILKENDSLKTQDMLKANEG